jgi:hypothetical protein
MTQPRITPLAPSTPVLGDISGSRIAFSSSHHLSKSSPANQLYFYLLSSALRHSANPRCSSSTSFVSESFQSDSLQSVSCPCPQLLFLLGLQAAACRAPTPRKPSLKFMCVAACHRLFVPPSLRWLDVLPKSPPHRSLLSLPLFVPETETISPDTMPPALAPPTHRIRTQENRISTTRSEVPARGWIPLRGSLQYL